MKKSILLLAAGLVMHNATAVADSNSAKTETKVERNADGSFKAESSSVDAQGNSIHREESREVSKTLTGNTKIETEATEVRDPKGMLNKVKGTDKTTEVFDKDGEYRKDSYSNRVDNAGTEHEKSVKAESNIKADGTTEVTKTTKVVTDPKGLMNRQEHESTTTTVVNPDGSSTVMHSAD